MFYIVSIPVRVAGFPHQTHPLASAYSIQDFSSSHFQTSQISLDNQIGRPSNHITRVFIAMAYFSGSNFYALIISAYLKLPFLVFFKKKISLGLERIVCAQCYRTLMDCGVSAVTPLKEGVGQLCSLACGGQRSDCWCLSPLGRMEDHSSHLPCCVSVSASS